MIVVLVFLIIAAALFAGAFITKRRFGLLGLALTAGATLSTIWSYEAGLIISSTGLVPNGPITNAVALSVVVLLPAVLLLFHGQTYKSVFPRLIGAALFTLLALAFLVEPLGFILPLSGNAKVAYDILSEYKDLIISVGVALAVLDLFFTKPVRHEKSEKKHHH